MRTPVDIAAASCVFPTGPNLPLADVALRSQLTLLRKHPTYVDRCGAPARVSCFPDASLPFDVVRWCALADLALRQLAAGLASHQDLSGKARHLWLVMPRSTRAGVPEGLAEALMEAAQRTASPWSRITTVHGEHAAGVRALRQACDDCQAFDVLSIVLAVDGWLHADAMAWLEEECLLHGARTRHEGELRLNPYGRVPGEGAAAVALCRANPARPSLARMLGAALAAETATRDTSTPCVGGALTQAAMKAITQAGQPEQAIGRVSSDMTAEPYRADELGFTTLQLSGRLMSGWTRSTPATTSGDLGAASSIAQLALAAYDLHRRPPRERFHQLILCSSDDSLRGAMLIGPSTT